MKCNKCGEETNFILIRVTAKWDDKKQDWNRSIDARNEEAMCDTCGSYDVYSHEK